MKFELFLIGFIMLIIIFGSSGIGMLSTLGMALIPLALIARLKPHWNWDFCDIVVMTGFLVMGVGTII